MANFVPYTIYRCVSVGTGAATRLCTFTKVSQSLLLLVLEVCNVQSIFRKPLTANLLVVSDFTLGRSFKVKLWWDNIKVPLSHL